MGNEDVATQSRGHLASADTMDFTGGTNGTLDSQSDGSSDRMDVDPRTADRLRISDFISDLDTT